MAAGGIAIGLVGGLGVRPPAPDRHRPVAWTSRSRVLTPFVAYVPAEELHVSGVLATVTAGLYVGFRSLDIIEPGTRLRTRAFWDSAAFLLDGLLFVLIGVQVPTILERIEDANQVTCSALRAADHRRGDGHALAVDAGRARDPAVARRPWPSGSSIAWSGMRGGVSLAAALAITEDGFPKRDLVIFVAYAVIVITLVLPGLTLAPLLRDARAGGERGAPARGRGGARCGSRRPRSSASTSSPTTRPSTSSSGCATATTRAPSACEARKEGDDDDEGRRRRGARRAS